LISLLTQNLGLSICLHQLRIYYWNILLD